MNETLKSRFNLTDEQIAQVLNMFSTEVIENALRLTKFDSRDLFKQNLVISKKYYK